VPYDFLLHETIARVLSGCTPSVCNVPSATLKNRHARSLAALRQVAER
jgi:hypothetical protein